MDKDEVRNLALKHGFNLKKQTNGEMDLNSYVYEFAQAIVLCERARCISAAEGELENCIFYKENKDILNAFDSGLWGHFGKKAVYSKVEALNYSNEFLEKLTILLKERQQEWLKRNDFI